MAYLSRRWRYLIRRWALTFRIYDADANVAASFRAQQVQAILRLTPITMAANGFNALIMLLIYRQSEKFPYVILWTLILGLNIAVGTRAWLKQRRAPAPTKVSSRAIKRAVLHASVLSMVWAWLPILMLDSQTPQNTILLIAACTGMLCAGGFALTTIPQAAISYVLILSLGCEIALARDNWLGHWNLEILLLLYAGIIIAAVQASAKTFGARLMAEAEAAHQQQLISLLLHDFEEHTSDWLWELNDKAILQSPSKKLLTILGNHAAQAHKRPFIELFDQHYIQQEMSLQNPLAALQEHLNNHRPFRELVLPIVIHGERHWWQLTAKPLFNATQQWVGWRGVGSDITHKRNAELEMQRLANVDALTGLANRHQFYHQLEALRQHREHSPFALFFLDLDNFKNVNDSLGHGVGDKVLQMVATRLQHSLRVNDLLARLGGDEFALICSDDDSAERAGQLAQRLLDTFSTPVLIGGKPLQIGCSIGIALAPEHGLEPESLLKNADMALYAAKSAGRNTYRFYESDMALHAQQKLHLLNDMRSALENHPLTQQLLHKVDLDQIQWPTADITSQFRLQFQPQIHLTSHRISGFEALLRWHHPERGLIPPLDFIPTAEESHLIIPLGAWVLMQACQHASEWPSHWRLAVNLSPVQFRAGNLVDIVRWALDKSGLAAERLELEITESLLLQDTEAAQETLTALRELGVHIALDDFGTGYSSLAYLRNFPLNTLKIDRTFVHALTQDTSALAIVNTIIQLAEALELTTVAEGIENPLEADILRTCGCSDAQGYFFGKPMDINAITDFAQGFEQAPPH